MNNNSIRENLKRNLLKRMQAINPPKNFVPVSSDLINLLQLPNDILENTKIVSFYNSNIHESVIGYQKKIFSLFDISLTQEASSSTHDQFLESTLKNSNCEYVIFFDIDAIPLRKEAIFLLLTDLYQGAVLAGAMQTAAHIKDGKNNYVGPFFMGINRTFYVNCGHPSLKATENFDVAGILTERAKDLSLPIKYWVPTSVEISKWPLNKVGYFGPGTTYNGLVYHAFDSRYGSSLSFISKCKQVLKQYEVCKK